MWVAAGSEESTCVLAAAGGNPDADYVRVTQQVTFPGRQIDPVTNTTIITPRITDFDPTRGNLAVIVRDRSGQGAPGHLVVISSFGNHTATTDETGCAFFSQLPADPADPAANVYDLVIDTPGHIESTLRVQRIDQPVTLAAQTTTIREYEYDVAAAYEPRPSVPAPQGGCDMTIVDIGTSLAVDNLNPNGANAPHVAAVAVDPESSGTPYVPKRLALRCLDAGGVPVPAGWQARIPSNLAYRLINPAGSFSPNGFRAVYEPFGQTAVPDTQTRPGSELAPLFPYIDGYGVHAGRCPGADPASLGGATTLLAGDPGQDEVVPVDMALVTITSLNPAGTNVEPLRHVFADMRDPDTCPGGDRLYLGRTDASGQLRALVPFGDWVFYSANAAAGADQPPAEPFQCAGRIPVACVQIRPDRVVTEAPVTGVPCPTPTYAFCGATTNSVTGYEITARRASDV